MIMTSIFRAKCIQYLERAEKLKTYINGKKKKPVAADGGSGKSAKNGKKGDKKDGSKDSGESQCVQGLLHLAKLT